MAKSFMTFLVTVTMCILERKMSRSLNYLEAQALLNQTINAVHNLVTSDATEAEVELLLGAAGGLQEAQSMLIKARLRLENDDS